VSFVRDVVEQRGRHQSPFKFEGTIREAVHQLKYRSIRILVPTLAGLMHRFLVRNAISADCLVPVPLHPKRMRERGFNQSQLLAKELSKLTGMPLNEGALFRTRYTVPQARTTSVEQRRCNMEEAFGAHSDRIKCSRVMLVDDVCTSATTMDACARALKESGAAAVWGLVLAREV
jgi:competence protein ComFC